MRGICGIVKNGGKLYLIAQIHQKEVYSKEEFILKKQLTKKDVRKNKKNHKKLFTILN